MTSCAVRLDGPICCRDDRAARVLASVLQPFCGEDRAQSQAHDLLLQYETLRSVLNAPAIELEQSFGLTSEQCAALRNAFEISSCLQTEGLPDRVQLGTEAEVVAFLEFHFRHLKTEGVLVLFLDAERRVIRLSQHGGADVASYAFDLRKLIASAIKSDAAFVVLAHNHPSGQSRPSTADVQATMRIRNALAYIGVELVDHIILGDQAYSMNTGCSIAGHHTVPLRNRLTITDIIQHPAAAQPVWQC